MRGGGPERLRLDFAIDDASLSLFQHERGSLAGPAQYVVDVEAAETGLCCHGVRWLSMVGAAS